MKYCFIVNPMVGKGKPVDKTVSSINAAAQKLGAVYDVFVSGGIDDTKEYIRNTVFDADGEVEFIACGGDGTLCETVLAVMSLSENDRKGVSVGVVPMGTGNDFVSNFENKSIFLDIEAQLEPTPYEIDLIKCNDMYSVNMVNVGFDSHVVCQKEKMSGKKWVPRKLAYIFALALTLVKKPCIDVSMSRDGGEREHRELLLTTMANGGFCGGEFYSNPKASLVDGKIDLIMIKNVGRIRFLTLVGKYKKGNHLGGELAHIIDNCKCESADMYFGEETPVSVDGEIIRVSELHLSVERSALRLMLPRGIAPTVRIKGKIGEPVKA